MIANYDPTLNPWNMDPPPPWVLRQLAVYDPELLILPGITEPVYRLARRSAIKLIPLVPEGEVQRMTALGVVPVTSVLNHPNWYELFQWLKDHDIWAHGGPDAAADKLDAHDKQRELDMNANQLQDLEHLAAEAFFAKQLRSGEVAFVQERPAPSSSPSPASGSAAPDHAE